MDRLKNWRSQSTSPTPTRDYFEFRSSCLSFILLEKPPTMGKKQKDPAYVLGVGMTKFIKPRGKVDYTELGFEVCAAM